MTKIITAKDILKQKGYVQNKFDTNDFIQVVADMFGDLPVEGILYLYSVRFVEKDFPFTKEEKSRGYYYLTDEYKKIQEEYAELKKQYNDSMNETNTLSGKIDKISDEIRLKLQLQLSMHRKDILNEKSHCPKEYLQAFNMVSDKIKMYFYDIKCSPALLYSVLKKYYSTTDKLINRLVRIYDNFHNNILKQRNLYTQLNNYSAVKGSILDLKPYTIYIDEPFFTNAASVLRSMCGYVVERKVRKGQKMYDVKLV